MAATLGQQSETSAGDCGNAKGEDFTAANCYNDSVRRGGIPIQPIRPIVLPGAKSPTL